MSKVLESAISGKEYTQDNAEELSLRYVQNKCIYNGLKAPEAIISGALLEKAEEYRYNPAKQFIESEYKKHDINDLRKLEQFDKVCNELITPDDFDDEYKKRLTKKWLVSCVKALFDGKGINSQGILILQGEQGMMKTTWFRRLAMVEEWFKEGYSLDPDNKDNIMGAIKYWIVELGEIESTFKKDLEKLKAFITQGVDELRRPYARGMSKFPRRTIFCGSVNGNEFLKDTTGNRRYWVVPCERIEFDDTIDMGKMWAEMYQAYTDGEIHYLTGEEIKELNNTNASFEMKDPVETLIETSFEWQTLERYWLTAKDIYNILTQHNSNNNKVKSTKQVATIIKKVIKNDKKKIKTKGGYVFYAVPIATNKNTDFDNFRPAKSEEPFTKKTL
jgi:putative DNA primase/helicase